MNYYIVNQKNKAYKFEHDKNILWAPFHGYDGKTKFYWDNMKNVEIDDIIFCNNSGKIKSVAIAKSKAIESLNPFSDSQWNEKGRLINVEYHNINNIEYIKVIDALLEVQSTKYGAFNKRQRMNQGYLFELTKEQADILIDLITTTSDVKNMLNRKVMNAVDEDLRTKEDEEKDFHEIQQGNIKPYTEEELEKLKHDNILKNKQEVESFRKSKRINTDVKLKATRLSLSNYTCENCPSHKTFTRKKGDHPYMECHHLIPLHSKKEYKDLVLDAIYNLVSLCPNCHAQIHYGDKKARTEVLLNAYKVRKKELKEVGINKAKFMDMIYKYYKV